MNLLLVLFFVGLALVLWIGISSRTKRRKQFEIASQEMASQGPFSVIYECLDQLVAVNANIEWIIVIDAKFPLKDSSGKVLDRYDRSAIFRCDQVKEVSLGPVITPDREGGDSDLVHYYLWIDSPTNISNVPMAIHLTGHRAEISPWIERTFGSLKTEGQWSSWR